jgi:hypothetical protein
VVIVWQNDQPGMVAAWSDILKSETVEIYSPRFVTAEASVIFESWVIQFKITYFWGRCSVVWMDTKLNELQFWEYCNLDTTIRNWSQYDLNVTSDSCVLPTCIGVVLCVTESQFHWKNTLVWSAAVFCMSCASTFLLCSLSPWSSQ